MRVSDETLRLIAYCTTPGSFRGIPGEEAEAMARELIAARAVVEASRRVGEPFCGWRKTLTAALAAYDKAVAE